MLKNLLVKTMMIVAVCGLVTTSAAKAGSATGVEKKSNTKVEKSHWGWTAGKVAGTGVGLVAGGIGGLLVTSIIHTLLEKNKTCEAWLRKELIGELERGEALILLFALATAAGAGYGGFKAVQFLQKKFGKPKAVAEQKVQQVVEQESSTELPAEETATEE